MKTPHNTSISFWRIRRVRARLEKRSPLAYRAARLVALLDHLADLMVADGCREIVFDVTNIKSK